MLKEHRLFFRQFRETFNTTGAIAPSSRALADALTRCLNGHQGQPRRVLEVGPGTGAVTKRIVRRLHADDELELVELNADFVRHLTDRFQRDPQLSQYDAQTRIIHSAVQDLAPRHGYDVIISGLPLNNFSVEQVADLLDTMLALLAPGGSLSFFEYLGVRSAKALVARPDDKQRLNGIGKLLRTLLRRQRFRRDVVLLNLPPAVVHHVRIQ